MNRSRIFFFGAAERERLAAALFSSPGAVVKPDSLRAVVLKRRSVFDLLNYAPKEG